MNRQLPLADIRFSDSASFDNFYRARNREPVEQLTRTVDMVCQRHSSNEHFLYFWGETGSGKTHLLQAACQLAHARCDAPLAYVPLAQAAQLSPAIFDDLENMLFVCVDDIHHICGDLVWETALFSLCERLRSHMGVLVAADLTHPVKLRLKLPDLATRLAWGLVYQLHPLADEEKLSAMQLRARNRGFDLPENVARYVLRRYPRDTRSLFTLLERIDKASLARKRRITIPFIRELES